MSITKRMLLGQVDVPKCTRMEIDDSNRLSHQHEELNEKFIADYIEEWISKFNEMTILQIHDKYQYKGYALSYYKMLSSKLGGKHELLKLLLIVDKNRSLRYMGYGVSHIENVLEKFRECGSYMVSYKNSQLKFTTSIK